MGKSSGGGATTQKQQTPVNPYGLIGMAGQMNNQNTANGLMSQYGTPNQTSQDISTDWTNSARAAARSGLWRTLADYQSNAATNASNINNGQFDANITPIGLTPGVNAVGPTSGVNAVGNISKAPSVYAQQVGAQAVSPDAARGSQGALDPTNSLSQLLSGQVNNPYLSQMQQASTQTATNQYNDAVQNAQQSLNYNVLPGLRSGAIGAGQYGSSRQGIAEGLSTGLSQQQLERNARDLGIASMNSGAQLYGNAYESAQGRMSTTANALDQRALDSSTGNANRDLTAQGMNQSATLQAGLANQNIAQRTNEFNANLGLQNNSQALNNQQFNANLGLQNNAQNLNNQQFNANLGLNNNNQYLQANQQTVNNRLNGGNAINTSSAGIGNTLATQQGLFNTAYNASNATDNLGLSRMMGLLGLSNQTNTSTMGANPLGGSTTTTQQQSGGSMLPGLLGAGVGLAGLASSAGLFGGLGSAVPAATSAGSFFPMSQYSGFQNATSLLR